MVTIVLNSRANHTRWSPYVFRRPILLIKKLMNLFLAIVQSKLKISKCIGYPVVLLVDPCNFCNLRCPLCPTGQRDSARSRHFMKFDDFKKLMDQIGDYVIRILFCNWGEPLMNKTLFRMIKYAKSKGIHTSVNTNLNLHMEIVSELAYSGIDECNVSIDGTNQEVYEIYRRGGNLSLVLENLRYLVRNKSKLSLIVWQFLVFRHNEHQVKDAIDLAKKIGVDVISINGGRADMGTEALYDLERTLEISKEYVVPFDSEFNQYRNRALRKHDCNWLWMTSTINPNGSVSACCIVWPEKFDLGNCFNDGFGSVWNNDRYRVARTIVRKAKNGKDVKLGAAHCVCFDCITKGNNIEDFWSPGGAIFMLAALFLYFVYRRFKSSEFKQDFKYLRPL